jgi:hypothetical protein
MHPLPADSVVFIENLDWLLTFGDAVTVHAPRAIDKLSQRLSSIHSGETDYGLPSRKVATVSEFVALQSGPTLV